MYLHISDCPVDVKLLLALQTSLLSGRGYPVRSVNIWNSSSTHGRLISDLVWPAPQHTVCDMPSRSLLQLLGENGRKTACVFVIMTLSVVWQSKVNGREQWCRCCLDRKSTAWVGNRKETCEQRWYVCVCVGDSFRWICIGMCDGKAHNCTRQSDNLPISILYEQQICFALSFWNF